MGAEASSPEGMAEGKDGLVSEILKLKAAKASGWLTEEEFVLEVKRVVQEFNGEAREPAYNFEQTVLETLSDEQQMAEWEARYGSEAAAAQPEESVAQRPAPLSVDGSVELNLTGGVMSPKQQNDLEKELEEMGAQVTDMGGESAESNEGGGVESGEVLTTPLSPTAAPTKLAPPSDDIDESPAK